MLSRLIQYWVYGGFLAGILLMTMLPVFAEHWSRALLAIFLQLPVYMLHQFEEHDNDRFREFVNRNMGGGRNVLSLAAVFVINVPGVWGVIAVSFYLAHYVAIGYGLIAIYLILINAIVHIVATIALRRYNPGLITSIVLFLPSSIWGIRELQKTGMIRWSDHLLGILVAVAIHAAIVAYVRVKKQRLTAVEQSSLAKQS